jgi:hypothetical protein
MGFPTVHLRFHGLWAQMHGPVDPCMVLDGYTYGSLPWVTHPPTPRNTQHATRNTQHPPTRARHSLVLVTGFAALHRWSPWWSPLPPTHTHTHTRPVELSRVMLPSHAHTRAQSRELQAGCGNSCLTGHGLKFCPFCGRTWSLGFRPNRKNRQIVFFPRRLANVQPGLCLTGTQEPIRLVGRPLPFPLLPLSAPLAAASR